MKPKSVVVKILGYLKVVPIFLGRLIAELVVDLVHYLTGRKRLIRWPEPTAATTLLPSLH